LRRAQAGQLAEARAEFVLIKELQPAISIAWIEKYVPYSVEPMAKFLEGMRKDGLHSARKRVSVTGVLPRLQPSSPA
jgi:hypothetical protein